MNRTSYTIEHIDYLQRAFLSHQLTGEPALLFRGVRDYDDVRLTQIQGLTRFWRKSESKALSIRQLMTDIFTGLHAERIPVVFMILGTLNRISVFMGTFRDNEVDADWQLSSGGIQRDIGTIAGMLNSSFPGIRLQTCLREDWAEIYPLIRGAQGMCLISGTPTSKLGTEQHGVEQVERLLRGMYGRQWGYLVIAKPYPRGVITKLHNDVLNELREITNTRTSSGPSPIMDGYENLTKRLLKRYVTGKTSGLWRVSAYGLGADQASYIQLRGVIQAIYGGEESSPDPLRTLECLNYAHQVAHLGQVTLSCRQPAPGRIEYPEHFASVLDSGELATLSHLPQQEMPGFEVRDYARFDVSVSNAPEAVLEKRIRIGEITDFQHATGNSYSINLDHLSEHGLVVGVTGSGKTNTAFNLLKQIWNFKVPFLVIEPAKTEYRRLMDPATHPDIATDLRVFTLGSEADAPFRINPFQVLPGVAVQTHIDHLKAVFNSSFAMYGPMPQILEQCIYEIYADRGWDLASGVNSRGPHALANPTLSDLYEKIDQVVDRLDYGPRITPELKAALKVRIQSLRIGGKGLMMDTPLSLPIDELLQTPTILELESVGDDDEKAFIMAILWVFIYES